MQLGSPQREIGRLMTGYWISQAIYVATKLGIADLLTAGPRDVEQLAAATGTHGRSLYRLLRALASIGIFAEVDEQKFAITALAEQLLDRPGSQRAMVLMSGEEHYQVWGDLIYSIKTGEVAFDKMYGKPIFDYLTEHPDKGHIFDQAMTCIHGWESEAVLAAYDFSQFSIIADIGGGNGTKIISILSRHPELQGILLDLPAVIQRAKPNLQQAGVADRCLAGGGDPLH